MEFLLGTLVGALAVYMVVKVTVWYYMHQMAKHIDLEKLAEKLVEKSTEIALVVRIEQHADMYYVYEDDTNQFLAQGKNYVEVEPLLLKASNGRNILARGNREVIEQFKSTKLDVVA